MVTGALISATPCKVVHICLFLCFAQEMQAASVEDKDFFKSELILSENAMEFANAVLTVDKSILKALKARSLNQRCQRMCTQILVYGVGTRCKERVSENI